MKTKTHEEMIRQVREAGESLIKNAESIVGSEEYLQSIDITVYINPTDRVPTINVNKEFLPERYIERKSEQAEFIRKEFNVKKAGE